ncbi:EboA domain-containing protein [Herbiconiux sp. CPCC 205763]|uniref:EboA domain-containing protein n=1 Tax=Herbiconiux aconitum TaxID=2970913 RepID=A0ABT2GSI6_9MICO|nr:EboA domain-containing protein [Herbiconiux aconitum]MCS5719187.1 EboA domain-containing protein [Herbiconiux aconitum]
MTAEEWMARAREAVREKPTAALRWLAQAGIGVGRDLVDEASDPHGQILGTTADAARAELIAVLAEAQTPQEFAVSVETLYAQGDNDVKRGVLRGLNLLTERGALPDETVTAGVALVHDALRANDPRLVASGMGAFAGAHLDQDTWRQGVIKLVFMDVPFSAVARLDERRDAELGRMARDLVRERSSAGRVITTDLGTLAEPIAKG